MPPASARRPCSGRAARARRPCCRGSSSAAAAGCAAPADFRQQVDGLAVDEAVVGDVGDRRSPSPNRLLSARGLSTAPERRCEPGCLPFSSSATGTSPSRSAVSGSCLDQLAEADRAGQARRAAADDQHADVDPLVHRVGRRADDVGRREGRRIVGRPDGRHVSALALACPDQLGELRSDRRGDRRRRRSRRSRRSARSRPCSPRRSCRSSACRPCAGSHPEMPRAMYSFGDTDLPVWPTWVAYGYQPASTTARVEATAPPSAPARSSQSLKPSGAPRPRPPATMMSASSIDGPLDGLLRVLDELGLSECSWNVDGDRLDVGAAAGLDRVERAGADDRRCAASSSSRTARRRCRRAPGGCRRACRPRRERSVRSQLTPASRRAARPAATSAESTDAANRTFSAPDCATICGERVDPRLRERRCERSVVDDVPPWRRRTCRPTRRLADARPEDNAHDVAAERAGLGEDAEGALLQLARRACSRKTRVVAIR